jgi:hypothetical protein
MAADAAIKGPRVNAMAAHAQNSEPLMPVAWVRGRSREPTPTIVATNYNERATDLQCDVT